MKSTYELTNEIKQLKNFNYLIYKDVSKNDLGFKFVYPANLKDFFPSTDFISYVSVLPGVGKTHWAINKMVKGVTKKDYIYLYVAPTIKLLKEVSKNLVSKLDDPSKCSIFFYKKDSDFKISERFMSSLNSAKRGEIFLITHALYLSLPELDKKKKIFAIFDEAQMIGVKESDITLAQPDLAYFRESVYLELVRKQKRTKNIKGTVTHDQVEKFYRVHGTPSSVAEYKKRSKSEFNNRFYKLLKNSINPKLSVYVMPKGRELKFFSFTSPKHSFKGFAKVYLMGAFFELSELYHILKREGHHLVDVSEKINLERQNLIRERFLHLSILPVLKLDRHLSLNMLNNQLILNTRADDISLNFSLAKNAIEKKLEKLRDKNFKAKFKKPSSILKSIFLGDSYSSKIDDLVKPLIKRYKNKLKPVFEYLMEACEPHIDFKEKPILITNLKYKNFSYANKEHKLKVLSPSIHGINKYSDKNTLIFMAALNAKPAMNLFYSHFIPEFSHENHVLASNIVQAVCRLNLRDINSTEPALLVVPTTHTAELVRQVVAPSLVMENIEILDYIKKEKFLDFSNLDKNDSYTKKKNYLLHKTKTGVVKLTTEEKFLTYPEYKDAYNDYKKISIAIRRFKGDKNELHKLMSKKIEIAKLKKSIKAKIAKKEGFDYKPR